MTEGAPKMDSHEGNTVISFETAKGSIYTYLPDGRVERFKAAAGENVEPSNVTVFIPDWDTIAKIAPQDFLEKYENELQLNQEMLSYIHGGDDAKVFVIDEAGNKIESQEQLQGVEQAFVCFAHGDQGDFVIPVSKDPKLNYQPFDTTKYKGGEEWKRRAHIGNKIVKINKA